MYMKTFLLEILAHIFTLLLAPFASKLIYHSQHSESLNNRKNSEIDDILLESDFSIFKHNLKT